jgi:amino acid transporter
MEQNTKLKKELGLVIATALVAGNIMGSGIFMLPATLASTSGPGATILAWVITGLGSIFLALSFARLSRKIHKTGGPYEYSKLAFGDFMGFINAWLYWNGSWIGNAAVLIAVTSYAGTLFPAIGSNHLASFLFASIILWIFTLINVIGVKLAGKVQTTITIFEIGLFLFFIISAALHFKIGNLSPAFPSGKGINTLPAAATATLWAFIGFESSSIAAGEIKNPEKNVARSTIIGISIAVVMYMAINIFAMGAMPQSALAKSSAPIAEILSQYFGNGIIRLITVGVVISILGTTIGWLLSTARIAYAAGKDGMFPSFFAKISKNGTPNVSLIVSAVLVDILLAMNYQKSLTAAFNFVILLATLSYLPVYAFTAAADMMLIVKREKNFNFLSFVKGAFVPLVGFIYACWTIYGSGAETVMYGFLLMLAGIPFYVYMTFKNKEKINSIRSYENAA